MTRKLVIPALFALVACSGSNGISFSARAGSSTSPGAALRPQANDVTLSNGIVLTRLRICLRDIRLEPLGGNTGDDSDDAEIRSGPMVVDLSGTSFTGSQVVTVTNATVKPGAYSEIKLEVHAASQGESTDPAVQAMAAQNASIIVDGTIDGVPFTFVTGVDFTEQFTGNLNIQDGSNLTLDVDPTGWFGGTGSARLDPRVSNSRSQIENNIKGSFEAFEDDDHDGHED
jgi:hypothetical protein